MLDRGKLHKEEDSRWAMEGEEGEFSWGGKRAFQMQQLLEQRYQGGNELNLVGQLSE